MFSLRHSRTSRTNGSCCAAFFRRSSFYCLIEDRSGATAIEYGLIAVLVSVAAIAAFNLIGGSLSGIFDLVTNAVADSVVRCVEVESNCKK
ncbi:MAG: Flp family type IVb pilin [Proteobacteria bacterium]|nr:Flp family type IVb pilin [Pseudomonadota bacterium]